MAIISGSTGTSWHSILTHSSRCLTPRNRKMQVSINYLREGSITLKNASGGALKEIISYLYLQHTTPEFDKFAMELVPLAEMYDLKGLSFLSVQALVAQSENETDVEQLLDHVAFAQLHKLAQLEEKSVEGLEEMIPQLKDVDRGLLLKVTKLAHQHSYDQLKTVCQQKLTVAIIHELAMEAGKYAMKELSLACGQWLTNNWGKVANNGELRDVMQDKTDGLFTQLMTLALTKQ